MLDDGDDISQRLPDGHLDLPRMREGGLTGAFFSIWVNPRRFVGEAAWQRALALIETVVSVSRRHPEEATLCTTADQVRQAARDGKIAILMGVEGAHALGTEDPQISIERLRELHRLGVRYMTITWSNDNPLGHSSGGDHRELGLTDLGRAVIADMNRLGMLVDVSHVSDRTFSDILDIATRPVLATHSSARALADHPRNMTDAMIRRVADNHGAVCVNYYTRFIDAEYNARRQRLERQHAAQFRELERDHPRSSQRAGPESALVRQLAPDLEQPTLAVLGRHFDHIVRLAGPETACLGSDFDGVGELPVGLEDVSKLPALRAELERRGLDVRAIFGENVLRVLQANHVR